MKTARHMTPEYRSWKKRYDRKRYLANKERLTAQVKRWRAKNRKKVKRYQHDWSLRKRFGISRKQYNRLLRKQGGVCAVCEKTPLKKLLAVDHDHVSGKIRGLLCHNCNVALGLLKESVRTMRSMIRYVKCA